jgi:CNT family concentrative nucleoside transporter
MTNSELHCLMTAGLATVAVNILGLYIGFLKDLFQDVAGHLICASILGAPAALITAKLVWPEDDEPETLGQVPPITFDANSGLTDSVIAGAMDGMKLIVGIVALLIAFLGLLKLGDWVLGMVVHKNLQELLGYVFRPLSLVMGVPSQNADKVGQLLGLRTVATEVVSYQQLATWIRLGQIDQRSAIISVYALCGFTHVASMAIFVGGTAALIPERRSDLAKVAFRALIAGTLATLIIGAVVGTCYTNQPVFLNPPLK